MHPDFDMTYLRILIVDDNQPTCVLIKTLLNDLGIKDIHIAESGQSGWTQYTKLKPDIILTDWQMSNMNGIEFVQKIRKDPTSIKPQIPIAMITSKKTKESLLMAKKVGVNDFIIKPFTTDRLAKTLSHLLKNKLFNLIKIEQLYPKTHPNEQV